MRKTGRSVMKINKFGTVSQNEDGQLQISGFDFNPEGAREIDAAECVYAVIDVLLSHVKNGIRMGNSLSSSPVIAPPVAAGSVDSIDTNEFCDLMTELQDVHERLGNSKPNWDALIAHIHAWGAQQRHEGFKEGVAQLQYERDNLLNLASSRREWAEKAEAELKQVNEWRSAALAENQALGELWASKVEKAEAERDTLKESLRLVNVDHGLWMTRTHAAEDARDDALARVKELEAGRQALQTEGKHTAPCARHCEANAFQIEVRRLERDSAHKQAIIDRLMLEYCPDEMTPEQMAEWASHQKRAE